jgi:hypothetical protein
MQVVTAGGSSQAGSSSKAAAVGWTDGINPNAMHCGSCLLADT